MRRIFAGLLLASFISQSTGAASAHAVTDSPTESLAAIVGASVGALITAIEATQVYAALTGSGERWALMHEPPPPSIKVTPRSRPVFKDYLHETWSPAGGSPITPTRVLRAIDPQRAPLDAHAMAPSEPRRNFSTLVRPFSLTPIIGAPRTTLSAPTFSYTADTTAGPTTLFYTVGGESGAISQIMDASPNGALTNESVNEPGSTTDTWGWVSPSNVPNSTSWPAQSYTVTLQVTAANANLQITEVKIYRVDSSGGPSTSGLAVVGDLAGLTQSLAATGTLTFSVSGSAQTASATDRIAVKFYTKNAAGNAQSFSYAAGIGAHSGVNQSTSGPNLTYQADTTAGPTTLFYTVGGETGAISQIVDATPTGAQTNESVTEPASVTDTWGWISPANVPNSTSWPGQTYTVNLNVAQANTNLQITEVKVYRVDSNGGPSTSGLAVVGDLAGLTQSLGVTGLLTFNVTGTAQAASASDRLGVKFYTKNAATNNQTFAYSAGQGGNSGILAPSGFGSTPSPTPAPSAPPTAATGVNRWWTYEEGSIPGVGKYMVNVGNGNLIVQSDDVDIPERGIDLAFRRSYNSLSQHDASNTDKSVASNFGNGWTTTFDAHVAYAASGTVLSVYDIDGARYDYTANGSGGWIAPPGMQGTSIALTSDSCHYQWLKKTGTAYIFYAPDYSSRSCSSSAPGAGFNGRIAEILGRNSNNYVSFNYSWDNGVADSAAHLAGINAVHQDGQQLSLVFQNVNSTGPRELHTLTRPDGQVYTYSYDSSGNLTQVNFPGNNVSATLWENYNYVGTHQLSEISSPRYAYSYTQTGGNPTEGSTTNFAYFAGGQLQYVQRDGVVNFAPGDGLATLLQAGAPVGVQPYYQENFSGYGASNCTIAVSGGLETITSAGGSTSTSITDTDGHKSQYTTDGCWRSTQMMSWPNPNATFDLVTGATWDGSNDLTQSVDVRGYATDYAYDSNGNTVAVARPAISVGSSTFRPTSLYSYGKDASGVVRNDIVAYCDPAGSHALGRDWSTNPGSSDSLCPSSTYARRYTWSYQSSVEPFGVLTDMYTAAYGSGDSNDPGYHQHIAYDTNSEGGADFGLPTSVVGDAISQSIDAQTPTRTPSQAFVYGANGTLTSYNTGSGTWQLHYDSINRVTSRIDPDGYTSYIYYYANGQTSKTETPYQHARSVGPTMAYDADGDLTQETVYHGGAYVSGALPTLPAAPPPTIRYYDGEDRLVEVQQPRDSSNNGEAYTNPWITRYLYDLTRNGSIGPAISIGGQSVVAYGNLYKTIEVTPSSDVVSFTSTAPMANATLKEMKGNSFDALDRPTNRYFFSVNSTQTGDALQHDSYTYDSSNPIGSNNAGALSSECNGLQQCTNYAYDADSRLSQTQHTVSTALDRTYAYDENARATGVTLPTWGTQYYQYDTDGRLKQSIEPSGLDSYATLTYHYYSDGRRSALDVSSTALNQTNLFAYAYRTDGKLETQQINQPGNTLVGSSALTFAYTAGGRLNRRTESGAAANAVPTQYQYDATYGYMTEMDYPAGKITGVEYDPSGSALGYGAPASSTPWTFTYSIRGEMLTTTVPAATDPINIMANGVAVNTSYKVSKTLSTASFSTTIDPRMGVFLKSDATDTGSNESTTGTTFDAIGRDTADTGSSIPAPTCDTCKEQDFETSRTYDQENHVTYTDLSKCASVSGGCTLTSYGHLAYDWGTDGHPIRITGNYGTETLHWDGDQLLFATRPGILDDVKIGDIGDITPQDPTFKGLTFWDRDVTRSVAFCHNATGAGGSGKPTFDYTTSSNNYTVTRNVSPCALASGQAMTTPSTMIWGAFSSGDPQIGNGGIITTPRSDGMNDGFNTIQGARVYDGAIGGWSTPDAYQGIVSDPMSQKGYTWNRSNPVAYRDPFGNEPWSGPSVGQDLQAVADGNLFENDSSPSELSDATGGPKREFSDDPGWNAVDAAAAQAISAFHDVAMRTHTEYGGRISCNLSKTQCAWSLSPDSGNVRKNSEGIVGGEVDVERAPVSPGLHTAAFWHVQWLGEMFSGDDFEFSINTHVPLYLGTPSGRLLRTTGFNAPLADFHVGEFKILCDDCAK